MTSKTSFFNIGIYKNVLHRFRLGSFLYFIILFMSLPFMLLVTDVANTLTNDLNIGRHLLEGEYMTFPLLLAICVPTIVSILVSSHVRSSKQGIFIHSLPVTRLENYVSSIIGAFTLMFIPVILNGIILMIMSFCGYASFMSPFSVLYWIIINCGILFIMFSVSTIASFLTGNGVAHAGINIFLHTFPIIIASSITSICNAFLYGFSESDNSIVYVLFNETPLVRIFSAVFSSKFKLYSTLLNPRIWIYLIGSVILYVLGYILYKNRKIEACGEVAAFEIFKPIFKYTLTALSALFALTIFTEFNINIVVVFIIMALFSAIVYFVCEMLINKTLKVFDKYKGYIGFAVCTTVIMVFCCGTSILGYETRVPKEGDVACASAYSGDSITMVNDHSFIENLIKCHSEIVQNPPIVKSNFMYGYYNINIEYKLKDDTKIKRHYSLPKEKYNAIMSKLYESSEYKLNKYRFDNINIENIDSLNISYLSMPSHTINANAPMLLEAVRKDVELLSYEEMSEGDMIHINFSIDSELNKDKKYFKSFTYNDYTPYYMNFDITINNNFKNTINYIKSSSVYKDIISEAIQNTYICKIPFIVNENNISDKTIISYKKQSGTLDEFNINLKDCVQIAQEDSEKLLDCIFDRKNINLSTGENYLIFIFNNDMLEKYDVIAASAYNCIFNTNNIPDYINKYISE